MEDSEGGRTKSVKAEGGFSECMLNHFEQAKEWVERVQTWTREQVEAAGVPEAFEWEGVSAKGFFRRAVFEKLLLEVDWRLEHPPEFCRYITGAIKETRHERKEGPVEFSFVKKRAGGDGDGCEGAWTGGQAGDVLE